MPGRPIVKRFVDDFTPKMRMKNFHCKYTSDIVEEILDSVALCRSVCPFKANLGNLLVCVVAFLILTMYELLAVIIQPILDQKLLRMFLFLSNVIGINYRMNFMAKR